jgi:putative hemolysin
MPTPAKQIKWALRNGNAVIVALSGSYRITRRPVHRIGEAHGCEPLRHVSHPGNKERALVASRNQRLWALSAEPSGKARRPILSSDPIGSNGRKAALP